MTESGMEGITETKTKRRHIYTGMGTEIEGDKRIMGRRTDKGKEQVQEDTQNIRHTQQTLKV